MLVTWVCPYLQSWLVEDLLHINGIISNSIIEFYV